MKETREESCYNHEKSAECKTICYILSNNASPLKGKALAL